MPEESAMTEITDIFLKCGIMDGIIELVKVDYAIRELENAARSFRPPEAPRNMNLSEFLNEQDAKKLILLRRERERLHDKIRFGEDCFKAEMKNNDMVLVKMSNGKVIGGRVTDVVTVMVPPKRVDDDDNDDASAGLAALFG